MRGQFGPCATRQIFVRGQFAPGKDVPGHRAQSPKLRTLVTSSRDIGSRKSEASSSCRVKHNHFEPVEKMCVVNREHNHYLRPSLLTDTILCCSQFSETPSTPETLQTRPMSYLRPSLLIVRIIRHRSEAGEEQRPVWASDTFLTKGKKTCMKEPYLVKGIMPS